MIEPETVDRLLALTTGVLAVGLGLGVAFVAGAALVAAALSRRLAREGATAGGESSG